MTFATWIRGLATGTQRARRSARPASRTRHFRPRVEALEDRTLLAAFATFQGDVATPKERDVIPLRVEAADFSLHRWGVFLGFEMHAVGDSQLDPSRIQVRPQSKRAAATAWQSSNSTTQSVTLAIVRPGSFQLVVGGDRRTTGDYQVNVFLVGDANADKRVDNRDVQLIRSLRGQRLGKPGYLRDADANRDGKINAADEGLARANRGAATRIRPLTLSAIVDPASVPGGVQPGAHSDIYIVGQTLPNAKVQLDQGADGTFDLTGTADAQGHYQFTAGVAAGTTRFHVLARGPFSQQRTTDLDVFLPLATPGQLDLTLDEAHTASAIITTAGGALSTTGLDGASYTLVIPPGALVGDQTISITPVAAIGNLHLSGGLLAAVQFAPDGLQFSDPVTLTIDVPAAFDTNGLFGFAYDGDGTNFRITPVQIAGHTLTFHVSHFSGVGAATGTALEAFYLPLVRQAEQPVIAAACGGGQIPNVCDEEDDTVHLLQDLKAAAVPVLRTWFLSGVQPLLNVAADSDAGLDNALTELFVWQGNATSLLCEPANGDCSEFFEPAGFQTFVDNARATLATALTAGINRTGAAVVDDPSLDNLQRLLNLSGTAQLLALEGHAQLALDKLDAGFRAMLEMGIQECRTNRSAGEEKLNQVFLFAQFVEESLLVDFQHAIRSCGITIQPSSANLTFEEQTQFTATLNGFSNTNVTWEVVPSAAGTIDAGGLFTAGTVFSGAFQVRATSVENTNKFAVAVVNVSITSVSVFPETVTLQPGETRQFTALVTGPINSSVTWTATGGTITQTGIFTAGQTAGTFVIEVTSVADPTRSASATVSVIANPAVNFAGVYEGPFQGFDPNDKPDPLVQFRYTITQSGNQLVIVRGPLFNDDERRFVATISGNSFTGFQDGAFSMDSVIVGTLEGNTITGSEDEDINEPSDHATFTVTRVSAS